MRGGRGQDIDALCSRPQAAPLLPASVRHAALGHGTIVRAAKAAIGAAPAPLLGVTWGTAILASAGCGTAAPWRGNRSPGAAQHWEASGVAPRSGSGPLARQRLGLCRLCSTSPLQDRMVKRSFCGAPVAFIPAA